MGTSGCLEGTAVPCRCSSYPYRLRSEEVTRIATQPADRCGNTGTASAGVDGTWRCRDGGSKRTSNPDIEAHSRLAVRYANGWRGRGGDRLQQPRIRKYEGARRCNAGGHYISVHITSNRYAVTSEDRAGSRSQCYRRGPDAE